jgi:hypothetical protein
VTVSTRLPSGGITSLDKDVILPGYPPIHRGLTLQLSATESPGGLLRAPSDNGQVNSKISTTMMSSVGIPMYNLRSYPRRRESCSGFPHSRRRKRTRFRARARRAT